MQYNKYNTSIIWYKKIQFKQYISQVKENYINFQK